MHRPGFYAERFQRFMCNTVFRKMRKLAYLAQSSNHIVRPLHDVIILCISLSLVKSSPSKKSRGGCSSVVRRLPMGGAAVGPGGQSAIDARIVYRTHLNQTDIEGESGKTDLLYTNL